MNKTRIGLGALMLASAATGIYFDDLIIRIVSGALFLTGAVLLYMTLSDDGGEGADDEGASPDDMGHSPTGRARRGPDAPHAAAIRSGAASVSTSSGDAGRGAAEAGESAIERPVSEERAPDIPEEYYRPAEDVSVPDDPRAEFDFLTRKLLELLRENLVSRTVALFWINRDRQQIVIGEFATESRSFTTARRLPLGSDLVSQVGTSGRPLVVTEIGPASEADLLPYYDSHEGVHSFTGVPVYFMDEAVAVIAADSPAPDAFGVETVAVIGKTATLIALMLRSYNQKFDLAADARLLGVLTRQRRLSSEHMDAYGAADAAAAAVAEVLDWDYVAVILYNAERRTWNVIKSLARTASLPYVAEGVIADVDRSVLSRALDAMEPVILDAPSAPRFRFHEKEALPTAGQLCVAPMIASGRCLGLLVVEYREGHQYGARDLSTLEHIASLGALYADAARLQELARKSLLTDEHTGAASRVLLLQRLREEIDRMEAHETGGVLFLLALDGPDELLHKHGKHGIERILGAVVDAVRPLLATYDVLGRYDLARLGLVMLHVTAEEAYLRGEKIRKAVSAQVIAIDGVTMSTSVSVAGCTFSSGMDAEQALRVAQQAMDRAVAEGGNCVKVV